ncbi:MAG: RES family NAD+ phosphorylase [Xanthobacteraceae bacterium]
MAGPHRIRDSALIDALESISPVSFDGSIWRVVRDGRDVLACCAVGGRWDDGTFDVLYTSRTGDGATAEMYFHLSRGQPVIPSRVNYRLFELRVAMDNALQLVDLDAVARLGVDTSRYGLLSYADRGQECPRTQEIAEAAIFTGFDGLIVPNARWNCANVILFCDRVFPDGCEVVKDHGLINWNAWSKKPFGF